MTAGSDGKIALQVVEGTQCFRPWDRIADPVIGGIATIATIASFTPLAPIARADRRDKRPSISPGRAVIKERAYLETGGQWTDTESLMNIGMVAMGVLPEASGGLRFLGMARRALNMTRSENAPRRVRPLPGRTGSISAVGDCRRASGECGMRCPMRKPIRHLFSRPPAVSTRSPHVTDAGRDAYRSWADGLFRPSISPSMAGDMSGHRSYQPRSPNLGNRPSPVPAWAARSFLELRRGVPHATKHEFYRRKRSGASMP